MPTTASASLVASWTGPCASRVPLVSSRKASATRCARSARPPSARGTPAARQRPCACAPRDTTKTCCARRVPKITSSPRSPTRLAPHAAGTASCLQALWQTRRPGASATRGSTNQQTRAENWPVSSSLLEVHCGPRQRRVLAVRAQHVFWRRQPRVRAV